MFVSCNFNPEFDQEQIYLTETSSMEDIPQENKWEAIELKNYE